VIVFMSEDDFLPQIALNALVKRRLCFSGRHSSEIDTCRAYAGIDLIAVHEAICQHRSRNERD
jgi:hypothetical protein